MEDLPTDRLTRDNIVITDSRNGPMEVNTGPRPEENEMSIKVRYRSDVALERNINIQNGCCIYYNEHLCQRNPERQLVLLPSESEIIREGTREEVKNVTREVLKYMENGLILEYHNRCIYVRRRCQSRIYYYSSQLTPGQDPIALKRDNNTKIFDYGLFDQELGNWFKNFMQGEHSKLIRPKICFTFGQSWQPYHKHHARGEDRPQPTAIDVCGVSMYAVPLKARDAIVSLEAGRDYSETLTMGLNSGHLFLSNEDREQCYELLAEAQETRLRNCHETLDQHQQQNEQQQQQQILYQQQQFGDEQQQLQQYHQQQFPPQQQFLPQDQGNYRQFQNDDGFQIEWHPNNGDYVINDLMIEADGMVDEMHDILAGYAQPITDPQQLQEVMSYLENISTTRQ